MGPRNAYAYLRALAEGIVPEAAAARYLGADTPARARGAHRETVSDVRAVARRRGDPAWRLIGVELAEPPAAKRAEAPSVTEWAAEEGLEDWPEKDLIALHIERFGAHGHGPSQGAPPRAGQGGDGRPPHARKLARNARLRERRLVLLRELERVADQPPQADDHLAGWFDALTTERLNGAGATTLADIQRWHAEGRRWWTDIPALGQTKAKAIAARIDRLIGKPHWIVDWPRPSAPGADDGRAGANRQLQLPAAIDATNDRAAIAAWVDARAGSAPTRLAYRREGERFLLWCLLEQRRALSDATVEDCRAYMAFLGELPARWVSRKKVAPYAPGWAPFAGALAASSRRHAVKIVASMFEWLTAARYLRVNPWALVNQKIGDARAADRRPAPTTKAFTPAAWQVLLADLERGALTPARARLKWLCLTCEATGLRAAELIAAVRGDIRMTRAGALLDVMGKGAKHREVPLPKGALAATKEYFALRGVAFDDAPPDMPLLGSLLDPMKGIGYDALYETFTRFVRRALKRCGLEEGDRKAAVKASLHWLRHTHATRFAERGGDLDVLQANLGHSDPRTSAGYFRAQIERRQAQLEKAFGDQRAAGH